MTFNPGIRGEYHTLVRIELDGKTLYYADSNLSMSDGNYYEGRLKVSALRRAFASSSEPKQRRSTLTLTLRDPDLAVRQLLDDYIWGFREATVLVGEGRCLDNYVVDFRGIITFPGGISYDRETVSVRLGDVRDRDTVSIPSERYYISDCPNLESGKDGALIPVIYGDYSDTPLSVVAIDTVNRVFRIASHPIKEIVQVYVNDLPVIHTDENLADATFSIPVYDPSGDVVTASVKGKTDTSGALIDNPAMIALDILTDYVGIEPDSVDTDSFEDLAIDLMHYSMRRYLSKAVSSETLICELGLSALFDIFIMNDCYTAKSSAPMVAYDTVYDGMIIAEDSFAVEADPEDLYANRMEFSFNPEPEGNEYRSFYQSDNIPEQTRLGRIVTRTFESDWLWHEDNVVITAQRYMLLYSQEINMITFTALGQGVLAQLSDRAALTFANFELRPLIVRETSKNFSSMTCEISGYDEATYALPGFWCADSAPAYADATREQRATQGFWTDEDGLADPSDPTSTLSHWW